MMFDISHGYRRKEDAIRLELVHISKQETRPRGQYESGYGVNTRFFYQKKKFQLPQYVPKHVHGYVLNGFDEIDQWHAESNASLKIDLRRWQSSGSIYFVFTQYRIVSPYHCNTGIEVDCDDRSVIRHFYNHLLKPPSPDPPCSRGASRPRCCRSSWMISPSASSDHSMLSAPTGTTFMTPLELATNLREDFTITEEAPTTSLRALVPTIPTLSTLLYQDLLRLCRGV